MMSDWSLMVKPHFQLPENDTFYRVQLGSSLPTASFSKDLWRTLLSLLQLNIHFRVIIYVISSWKCPHQKPQRNHGGSNAAGADIMESSSH